MEKCKTLGENTYFEFSLNNDYQLSIRYGNNQNPVDINQDMILAVIARVQYLEEQDHEHLKQTGYYEIPQWAECPNTVQCPYIAKLVLDVFPTEVLNHFN